MTTFIARKNVLLPVMDDAAPDVKLISEALAVWRNHAEIGYPIPTKLAQALAKKWPAEWMVTDNADVIIQLWVGDRLIGEVSYDENANPKQQLLEQCEDLSAKELEKIEFLLDYVTHLTYRLA